MRVWPIILGMALCATLTVGCISTEHADGSKDTTLLGFIPLAHTDADGNTTFFSAGVASGTDWLSLGLKVLTGLGVGFAFPRPKENLIGIGQAIGHGDLPDAGKHVLALTSLFKTPEPVPAKEAA
jgi:hypothetical protein